MASERGRIVLAALVDCARLRELFVPFYSSKRYGRWGAFIYRFTLVVAEVNT